MQSRIKIGCAAAVLALAAGANQAQTAVPATRGQLLYENHCMVCHDKQVHWRDAKVVTSWATLLAQVRRWQALSNLAWSDEDVLQVARHLNTTIYRFPAGALAQSE